MISPSLDTTPATPSGGAAAGNARLTALAGITLLALFTAEIVTVILGVSRVLTAHVAIALALTPVFVLKTGSTGWRFVKYYRGDRAYVRRGAPPAYLRILGPVLIVATAGLLGCGMLAFAGPHWLHSAALTTHKTLFYPWPLFLIVHTAGHFTEAMRLATGDLLVRARARLAGAGVVGALWPPRSWPVSSSLSPSPAHREVPAPIAAGPNCRASAGLLPGPWVSRGMRLVHIGRREVGSSAHLGSRR
jgi:hypothetical protein